ncbi:bifunctional diaminohydroxyphosphoribosylaminopyrimidine deaminase/5-amino-6-(5-phosphoribosylamino)uracil reductase RibD [Pontimicrobium aquaticum]|uniref:Riboflavin biosynthesis protein RibD n=1 Tax=Pontimicrobium aquaticum TaxID=2565367 RepID=A0A4U0EW19_9FLAO|nr:bifunctional diaminohydroxyphosphoribosylaminopyrimidine deaminase/5-amino-6-(5-phosphoribosylamino)uracil reductase RibD [Pontimicrobium aquaticum]TJY36095.1 bifunctional diaminohydroxyphosphoribosylaminopyrimidine deaminase/5-amino-6-(5-phosphoribosylamino)uracil reductase RibD [Pontimicrobium aquaticum]
MKQHETYIQRCIDIAKNGLGSVAPNPMVGCVIVSSEKIIGEGFTSPYGGAHAEINAINSVKDKSLLKKATLYVTLEPCSHFGKTPPCADAIIKYQIPKVIIGTIDTHSKVAGQGITKLRAAGCNVIVGVLEDACKEHHKRFFTFHNKQRPYIILKWAETADGFIAPLSKDEQKPVWITNEYSRQIVHKWRAEEQAILVGTNTVIEDNPSLTTRDWEGKHPIRIVLDKKEALSKGFNVFDDKAKTIVIKEKTVKNIYNALFKSNINSVIIEGGSKTLQLFIDSGIWDEARIFTGKSFFKEGVKAPKLKGKLIADEQILDDTLKVYVNN